MATKRIKAKEFLSDMRAGMDDAGLMEKYGLSAKGILRAMTKLISEGLMSASELAARRSLAKTVYMPVFNCKFCGDTHFSKMDKCPRCGSRLKTSSGEKSGFGH
jgi:rubrerythrin